MTNWIEGLLDDYSFDRYGTSPYYDDDLEIVAELSAGAMYEFDLVVAWRKDGEIRAAYDAGCSCPTPFGDLTWECMKPIRDVRDLDSLLDKSAAEAMPTLDFVRKIARALR